MLSIGLVLGAISISNTLITFIVVLGLLVFVHEFGHYIVAKATGVRVEEFALGFGPKIVGFKKGETVYSLRIFPLGGFCKMTGEFPNAEEDLKGEELIAYKEAVDKKRALYQKSLFERFAVIFTGPLMNFVLAAVLFAIVFATVGISNPDPVIGSLVPGGSAQRAGLKAGDRIVEVDGIRVDEWNDISFLINQNKTDFITLKVQRNDEILNFKVKPETVEGKKVIGIYSKGPVKLGLLQSILMAVKETWFWIKNIIIGFYQMITLKAPAEIGGPILIAKMVGEVAAIGWAYLLQFTALLSINLGIINLIPFPALDGGRILFLFIELIRGKSVDPEKEGFVHFIGFIVLIALMVLIIYRDIAEIF